MAALPLHYIPGSGVAAVRGRSVTDRQPGDREQDEAAQPHSLGILASQPPPPPPRVAQDGPPQVRRPLAGSWGLHTVFESLRRHRTQT